MDHEVASRPLDHSEVFRRSIRAFRDLAPQAGVYCLVGNRPEWLESDQITLRFHPSTTEDQIAALLGGHDELRDPRPSPDNGLLWHVTAPSELRAVELARTLTQDHDEVLRAEPQRQIFARPDAISVDGGGTSDPLDSLWDRQLMGAHQIAPGPERMRPVVVVVDKAEPPPDRHRAEAHDALDLDALRHHPDLAGADLEILLASLDRPHLHGIESASLIASPTLGIAPGVKTRLVATSDFENSRPTGYLDAYRHHADWSPAQVDPDAHLDAWIFSDATATTSSDLPETLRELTRVGRGGKGCLHFVSAGNEGQNISIRRRLADSPFTMTVAATTWQPGEGERAAAYSNWGDIDFCVPSGPLAERGPQRGEHRSGVVVATWPNRPGAWAPFAVETRTEDDRPHKTQFLRLETSRGFIEGSTLLIVDPNGRWQRTSLEKVLDWPEGGIKVSILEQPVPTGSRVLSPRRALFKLEEATPGTTHHLEIPAEPLTAVDLQPGDRLGVSEYPRDAIGLYTVREIRDGAIRTVEEVQVHPEGSCVFLDRRFRRLMSGTSASTPRCAGVAALMLQAAPRLTWVQVRHILRTTARPIDVATTDFVGRWLDQDGQPTQRLKAATFSRRYGYGRIQVDDAIREAKRYAERSPTDLWIRRAPGDDGTRNMTELDDSPDIWISDKDPVHDPDAGTVKLLHHAVRGQDDWIFVRIRNRGTEPSLEAWVRVYVAAGQESFRFPEDFPKWKAAPSAWRRQSHCLGEISIVGVPPGGETIVWVRWPTSHKPPKRDPAGQLWDPRVLVEITPLDGPLEGHNILTCNNLAHRRIDVREPPT
ncbi:MAG: S8 family serine peptidase [Actinomycetota bacterium]